MQKADATRIQSARPPANPVWCGPQFHTYEDVVVAVFPDAQQVGGLLTTLQQAGLAADQVGLAARTEALTCATGLLARSTPELDLFDALVELGIPPDAARLYRQSFEASQAIVAIRSAGRSADVVRVLRTSAGSMTAQLPVDAHALERRAADRPAERARPEARGWPAGSVLRR